MDKLLPVLWPQPWWAIGPVGVIGWVLGLVTAVAAAGALMVFSISASEDYPPPAKLTARAVMAPVALAAAWALMNAQRIVSHFQHTARDRIVLGVLLGAGGLIVVAIVGCLVIGALSLLLLPFTAAARATAKRERLAKEEADRVEAEREAAAHHAARQEFYRSNHVFGTAGGSVAGTSDKFGADRARIGHRGEEVVGRRLDELVAARPDSWLFHDLKWPPTTNTRANIDHAVLVGSQLVLIDAKRWAPGVFTRDINGFALRDGSAFPSADKDVMASAIQHFQAWLPGLNVTAVTVATPTSRGPFDLSGLHPVGGVPFIPIEVLDLPAAADTTDMDVLDLLRANLATESTTRP